MSSWQASQLKYAFGLGGLMSFYGIVAMIVYLLPGQFVGRQYKILIIVLVLLTIPFALLIGFVASRRRKKKEAKKLEEAGQVQAKESTPAAVGAQKLATPTGNYGDLSSGVEEVIQFLKSSNLGESGRDALYSLPWYIVAGAPRSGKTSLALGSSLNFQTLPSQRQSEQKVIRPTPNVDWRVASEGVFFDTAGRYQTEGVDGDEWAALIETIKKARPNRPLDGLVLVVDTEQILKSDERESEEVAKVLRARLDDVIQRLKIRFPVYLVFTHADAMEGFRDSFSTSKGEDKTLVWGTTIPLEKSENAQAMFDSEYEILQNSVMKRRLLRLSAPFPPVRQLRIFNFPLHFSSARRKLGAFMTTLFRPNPFSENPFLRGYYFTAAPTAKAASGVKTAGNPYFTERLFRDVILRDKDLVRTFMAQRQTAPIFGWFLTLTALFITFLLLVMAGISLGTNRQMLNDAKDKGDKLLTIVRADANKNTLDKKEDEVRRELNSADNLLALLVQLDDYERNGPLWYMRFGLYSGNRIYKQQLLPIYMTVIEQRFKAPTVRKVETDLRKFAASQAAINPGQLTDAEEENLGKNYDLLKAYLMLSGGKEYKDKSEPTHLVRVLRDYWVSESKIPADMNLTALAQLDFWAKQVDRDDVDYRFPRISPDGKLIADVREKLKAFPAKWRYYKRKVSEISKKVDDADGAATVTAILTRKSSDAAFMDGSYQVPGAYTRNGNDLMKIAVLEANEKLSEDDWVMGDPGKGALASATDAADIETRYYQDYADNWKKFIQGISVKTYKNKDEATSALLAFSDTKSPMKTLLTEVARNTNLSAKPDVQGWWDWIKSFFTSTQSSGTGGNTEPEKQFRPLFDFVGTKDQKETTVDKYQTEIGKVWKKLSGMSQGEFADVAQQMAAEKDPLAIRPSEANIINFTKGFSVTPSSAEIATLLQKPLGNLKDLVGSGVKQQIAKAWSDQILPSAKDVEKGFPYDDTDADVDLTKLTAYLNPNDGAFSKFYKDRLEKYFEVANGQLKLKDSADIKDFTPEFIAYLNNVMALRKALFGTNPTAKFEYEFTMRPVTGAIFEVTIDGQTTDSSGTGSLKGTFPAPSGTQTGVIMKLASTASPTTTTAPAANSASNSKPASSSSSSSSLTKGGTWGLFRFVDAGKPQKHGSGEYLLSYSLGGKSISATIKSSGGDLFDKSVFRSAKAPQNLFK